MPQKFPVPVLATMLPLLFVSCLSITPAHAQDTPPAATTPAPSPLDPNDPLARIRDEGMNRSQVAQTLSYLCDVIGPRLTASPGLKRANQWTASKMTEWGLSNAHQESWGPFGRGWTQEKFSAQVVSPSEFPLIAYPKAWSPGVKGTLTAPVVYYNPTKEEDLATYKGKLKGAIVLNGPIRELAAHFQAQATRYTDEELATMAAATPGERRGGPGGPGGRPPGGGITPEQRAALLFTARKNQFLYEQEPALLIDAGRSGDDGTVYVQSASLPPDPNAPTPGFPPGAPPAPGTPPTLGTPPAAAPRTAPARRVSVWSKEAEKKKVLPQIVISAEQYNRLARMALANEPVKMAVEMKVKFYDDNQMVDNTIAEIPGTDKKDEIVMCGAHMDSWHTGTGATDNGAGTVVCMEAMRILKALNLPLRRTVRVALWSGEEQGLYGSQAYVTQHFGTMERGVLNAKPEQAKISAYFNLDNGTGKVRGIYCQGNEAIQPIFAEWLKPFADLGATTTTIRNTGSTDHVSFDSVNVPGFQFIQDTIEYNTRTHHSNMDVYDRAQIEDLKQASVLMAAFLYNAAQRDDLLPRKPIPAPTPTPTN